MPFNPAAGKEATISIGSTDYAFSKVTIAEDADLPNVSNFTSGYKQYVVGLLGSKVTLEGPYDIGNMPFTLGNSYNIDVDWNGTVTLTLNDCILNHLEPSTDIADAARVKLEFTITGTFTADIT